jgi:hypothetical protein
MMDIESKKFAGEYPQHAEDNRRKKLIAPLYFDIQKQLDGNQKKADQNQQRHQIDRLGPGVIYRQLVEIFKGRCFVDAV